MVEFASWQLPVQYSGIKEEHNAVRQSAGLFDIGHMGQIETDNEEAVQSLTTNDISNIPEGKAQYTFMCEDDGGIVDDLIIYRMNGRLMIVSNGANSLNVYERVREAAPDARLFYGERTAVALQGPDAQKVLSRITDHDLGLLKFRNIAEIKVSGKTCLVSRSGYSGEDGFELFLKEEHGPMVWTALLENGAVACGLGARDTLRIEAGLPLYGHELTLDTTPVEAGFARFVAPGKGSFKGSAALSAQISGGITKKLFGFKVDGKGIPRQGYQLKEGSRQCGYVTSGTLSPTLGIPIGLGYKTFSAKTEAGTEVTADGMTVDIRGTEYPLVRSGLPFYKRKKL